MCIFVSVLGQHDDLFEHFEFPTVPNNSRAVYTGIKKPEFFSHTGFSLEVDRQLPLNTAKNLNRKTHLWSVVYWNSAGFSLFFCQCKRSLPSHRYYWGFWSHRTWPSAESPAARDVLRTIYVRSKVERSRVCAPLTTKPVWDLGFFAQVLFCNMPISKLPFHMRWHVHFKFLTNTWQTSWICSRMTQFYLDKVRITFLSLSAKKLICCILFCLHACICSLFWLPLRGEEVMKSMNVCVHEIETQVLFCFKIVS